MPTGSLDKAAIFEFAGLRRADAAGGCPLSEPAVSKVKTATDSNQRASDKITKLAAFFLLTGGGRRRLFINFRQTLNHVSSPISAQHVRNVGLMTTFELSDLLRPTFFRSLAILKTNSIRVD